MAFQSAGSRKRSVYRLIASWLSIGRHCVNFACFWRRLWPRCLGSAQRVWRHARLHSTWRADAEAILDGKTPEMTWGQIITRIERATGWRAVSPQVLIAHQRAHRAFQTERTDNDQTGTAWGTCIEAEDIKRN